MAEHSARAFLNGTAEVPAEIAGIVMAIKALLADYRPFAEQPPHDDVLRDVFESSLNLEDGTVLGIEGKRGSGKTTILVALCSELLDNDNYIVLPIIRPETFRSTDSLLSIVVGHVRRIVEKVSSNHAREMNRDFAENSLLVQEASKVAALTTAQTFHAATSQMASLSQYALDALGLLAFQDKLVPTLRTLMSVLRMMLSRSPESAIVVPIDDGDLVPKRTSEIFGDLRTLLSVGGIAPVMCVSRDDLQVHLEADFAEDFGTTVPARHRELLAKRQIEKLMSPARTVSPPFVKFERRAGFTPIGEHERLDSLFGAVLQALDGTGIVSKEIQATIRNASAPVLGDPVTALTWLPDTPRALQTLWRTCYQLTESLRTGQVQALAPWLKRFIDVLAGDGTYRVRLDVENIVSEPDGIAIQAEAAWTTFELSVQPEGAWQTAVDEFLGRIRFRRFGGPGARLVTGNARRDQESESDAVFLDSEDVASALLIQDIFRLPSFKEPRPAGPSSINVFDFRYIQEIRLLDQETDDQFLTMPVSCGLVYVERAKYQWNALVSDVTGMASQWNDYGRLLGSYVNRVTRGWLLASDARPDSDGNSFEADLVEDMQQPDEAFLRIAIHLAGSNYLRCVESYDGRVLHDYTPAKGFAHWFEIYLPRIFNELFIPQPLLRELVDYWAMSLSRGGRSSKALEELRQQVRDRVKANTNPPTRPGTDGLWLLGYRTLFERVSEEAVAALEHLRSEYDRRRSRAALGRATTEDAVELVSKGEGYEYATSPSEIGNASLALVSTVLAELRQ